MDNDLLSIEKLTYFATDFWKPFAIFSAHETGIFKQIAKQPLTASELVKTLHLSEGPTENLLHALVELGILSSNNNNQFFLHPPFNRLLNVNHIDYVGGIIDIAKDRYLRSWSNYTEYVRSGTVQSEAHDKIDLFPAIYDNTKSLNSFVAGMSGLSKYIARLIAIDFPWKDYKDFVDIGACDGTFGVEILLNFNHLKGQAVDNVALKNFFDKKISSNGLDRRYCFLELDFFQDDLPTTDVFVLGQILHDWSRELQDILISKCYSRLKDGGALIIYDPIIPDTSLLNKHNNLLAVFFNLHIQLVTKRGSEYSYIDIASRLKKHGFSYVNKRLLFNSFSAVYAFK